MFFYCISQSHRRRLGAIEKPQPRLIWIPWRRRLHCQTSCIQIYKLRNRRRSARSSTRWVFPIDPKAWERCMYGEKCKKGGITPLIGYTAHAQREREREKNDRKRWSLALVYIHRIIKFFPSTSPNHSLVHAWVRTPTPPPTHTPSLMNTKAPAWRGTSSWVLMPTDVIRLFLARISTFTLKLPLL